jgi:hypothetical protein
MEVQTVMPPRKSSKNLLKSFAPAKPLKPKTIAQLGRVSTSDYTGPTGPGDPDIVETLERAMAECRPVTLVYREDAGEDPRVVCAAAMGMKRGSRMVLVYQARGESETGLERTRERFLYVAGIRQAEVTDGEWTPMPGDILKANCFKGVRPDVLSQSPGAPERPGDSE